MLLYTAPFVVAVGARFLPQPEALTLDRWARHVIDPARPKRAIFVSAGG